MKKRLDAVSGFSLIVFILLLAISANINAQERDRKERAKRHEKTKKEVVVKRNNDEYRDVAVKDRHYFYREGYFYDKRPEGYVRIEAPIGASITILPAGYKIVRVRKIRYYLFGGIYYKYLPRKKMYAVVKAPL